MRWLKKKKLMQKPWHKYFAWRPVQIGKIIVWLEIVERSGGIVEYRNGDRWDYTYRFITKCVVKSGVGYFIKFNNGQALMSSSKKKAKRFTNVCKMDKVLAYFGDSGINAVCEEI